MNADQLAAEAAGKFFRWQRLSPKGLSVDEMLANEGNALTDIIKAAIEKYAQSLLDKLPASPVSRAAHASEVIDEIDERRTEMKTGKAIKPAHASKPWTKLPEIVGSCNCLTKTPDPKYHLVTCRYRQIMESHAHASEQDAQLAARSKISYRLHASEQGFKCATFDKSEITPEIQAKMDANRKLAREDKIQQALNILDNQLVFDERSLLCDVHKLLTDALSQRPTPATPYNIKIVALAKAYCDAHREDYETMSSSDSMDVDADFILLFQAINGIPIPATVSDADKITEIESRAAQVGEQGVVELLALLSGDLAEDLAHQADFHAIDASKWYKIVKRARKFLSQRPK